MFSAALKAGAWRSSPGTRQFLCHSYFIMKRRIYNRWSDAGLKQRICSCMQICVRAKLSVQRSTLGGWRGRRRARYCLGSGRHLAGRARCPRTEIPLNEPFGMQQKAFADDGRLLCAPADTLLHAGRRWYIALRLKRNGHCRKTSLLLRAG